MSETILVTGAAGFVGQHLVERLASQGHQIIATDIVRNIPDRYEQYVGGKVEYVPGSIINENFVKAELFRYPAMYDRVFHLAAIVGVDRYTEVQDPLYLVDVNINGTTTLLDQIKATDTRFVYTSTSEVYGRNPDIPWKESADQVVGAPTKSRWSYSVMKSTCEHILHMFEHTHYDLTTTVVRPFNLYGPGQREQFVISKFIRQVQNGDPPTVYNDGSQQRCFTYIDDFIDGMIRASQRQHDGSEVYNLGNTEETTIADLAATIVDIAGTDESPEFVNLESIHSASFEEPERRIPDVTKARERLDWEATTPLREGLEQTFEWMQSNGAAEDG